MWGETVVSIYVCDLEMRPGLSWLREGREKAGGQEPRIWRVKAPKFPHFLDRSSDFLKARLPNFVVVEETHLIQMIQSTGRCPASSRCCSEETE